jgi:septum formation protein
MHLVLASASPRRAELLTSAGYEFSVRIADVDERVRPGERPVEYVRRLAVEKADAVRQQIARISVGGQPQAGAPTVGALPDVLIIGADTAVIVDDAILGKPDDDADAERMLRLLSGRSHQVLTGVSVGSAVKQLDLVEQTTVHMAALSEADMAWYVASGEGRDKAGGYAIQGRASRFIPRIEGSYANVVGLPVARLAELIEQVRGMRG